MGDHFVKESVKSVPVEFSSGAEGQGQKGWRKKSYWNASYTRVPAEGNHLALLLSVEEVVIVLHGDKLMPAVLLRNVL